MTLNYKNLPYLPEELVNIIADYHDYEKYYKPFHFKNYQNVMNDIINMGNIMDPISAQIAWNCWGPGFINQNFFNILETENIIIEDEMEIWINDDEENNFGLDYDDTHYYNHGFSQEFYSEY